MINFLIFLVVVLGVILFVQIIRVFELNSTLKGDDPEEITEKDNKLNARLMLIFLILFLGFCAQQVISYKDMLLPVAASEHGVMTDNMLWITMLIIGIVFVITHILLFFYAFRFYFRNGRKASFITHSTKIEIAWTVIPTLVLAGLIVYGLDVWQNITSPEKSKEALAIEIYAKQFDWTARYPGGDEDFGNANFRLIEGLNIVGLDSTDENSWDDILTRELHLVVNKPVNFNFRSRDVIHSAYMPHFRLQMNCVPGMTTQFYFTPTKTSKEMKEITGEGDFEYLLLCAKICGVAHHNMQMKIVVETQEEYDKWLGEQPAFYAGKAKSTIEHEEVEVTTEIAEL